jgi:hypothetical protein
MGSFILVVYYRWHFESKSTWQFCQEAVCCGDMLVHILAHLTIFTSVGYMAYKQDKDNA